MFNRIKRAVSLAGLSAGMMYVFDPDLGRRRRSLMRDQVNHFFHRFGNAVDVTARDFQNRLYGTVCEIQHMFGSHDTSDDVLKARVRTKLGRHTSHPRSIEVAVHDHVVTLCGPCLADEVQKVVQAVEMVDGVERVENHMSVHEQAGNLSALQGGSCPGGEPFEFVQENWSPTARLVAGTLGGLAMVNCMAKRTPMAILCGTGGLLLFARAMSNHPLLATAQDVGGRATFGHGTSGRGSRQEARTGQREQQRQYGEPSHVAAGSNVPQGGMHRASIGAGAQRREIGEDLVDEASIESFPASDAPGY